MKRIVTTLALVILAPIVAGLLVEIAKPALPNWPTITRWAAMIYDAALTPWITAGVIGLLLGMWLDPIMGRFDGRHPMTRAGKLKALSEKIEAVAFQCQAVSRGFAPGLVDEDSLRVEILLLGKRLTALGLAQPYIPIGMAGEEQLSRIERYLRAIHPAARDGEVEVARQVAEQISKAQRLAVPADEKARR